jgi:hypothetical protein
MNPTFSEGHGAFSWNNINNQEVQTSWALVFHQKPDLENWRSAFGQAMYETLHQSSWKKIKVSLLRLDVFFILLAYPPQTAR